MMKDTYEKTTSILEHGNLVPSHKNGVHYFDKGCDCMALEYKFKFARLIFGAIIFTTHLVGIVCLFLMFENVRSNNDKILALQMDLKAVQFQCNSSVRFLQNKLKYLEAVNHENKNITIQDENENGTNYMTQDLYSNSERLSIDIMNINDSVTAEESNSFEDYLQNLTNFDYMKLQPQEPCSLLASNGNVEEYSRLCGDMKQSSRTKRSNQRGKHKGRTSSAKRRVHPNKKPNIRGPIASHFKGGVPETLIRDGGLIAPWFADEKASAALSLKYEFRKGNGTVEITEEGLYFIYAQIYYLTSENLNSFLIQVKEKDGPSKPVAYCSSNAVIPQGGGVTEVSCYTAVIRYLNVANEVYISQRDRNRRMIMRDGHSFLGLVFLNSLSEPKKRRGNRN